jgi:hypothetical protein
MMARLLLVCWLGLGVLLLTGCGLFGQAEEVTTAVSDPAPAAILGSDTQLSGQGILTCNTQCSNRAQCGFMTDQTPVVLVGRTSPRIDGHDAFAVQGTAADILNTQTVTLQNSTTGEQFPTLFYLVRTSTIESGWVAGWCIQQ